MIATLDKDSIQKQINVLEKSLSNAAALKQNETNQNQRALERAKEDQKNQLAQANDSINSAEAASLSLLHIYRTIGIVLMGCFIRKRKKSI